MYHIEEAASEYVLTPTNLPEFVTFLKKINRHALHQKGIQRRHISSLVKALIKALNQMRTDDILNFQKQKNKGTIPDGWAVEDLVRPVPLLMKYLSSLQLQDDPEKPVKIYLEQVL